MFPWGWRFGAAPGPHRRTSATPGFLCPTQPFCSCLPSGFPVSETQSDPEPCPGHCRPEGLPGQDRGGCPAWRAGGRPVTPEVCPCSLLCAGHHPASSPAGWEGGLPPGGEGRTPPAAEGRTPEPRSVGTAALLLGVGHVPCRPDGSFPHRTGPGGKGASRGCRRHGGWDPAEQVAMGQWCQRWGRTWELPRWADRGTGGEF